MGKRIFTKEQTSAIECRDKTLLVCAAAGSGKTATLTERIIRSLIDGERSEDISNMLIVTFTNAAVKELRERISAALSDALLQNPENKRLEKQIYMLSGARICTIDSFCNEILRNNTHKFGISPMYRIADPTEASLLSHSIMSGLIEAAYNGNASEDITTENFEELAFSLVGVKSDSALEEQFMLLFERTKSLPEGVLLYKNLSDELRMAKDIPILENKYAKYAKNRLDMLLKHYTGVYSSLIDELDSSIKAEAKYIETLEGDLRMFEYILSLVDYKKLKTFLDNSAFSSLPPIRGEKSPAALMTAMARSNLKEDFNLIKTRYFSYSEDEWTENLSDLSRVMMTLYRFLSIFDTLLFEEKRRRGILEHSDVERLAYNSLYDDGKLSEYAVSLKNKFSSVYIDEYQDVNALQGKIFDAVSNEKNRFMVGDIKQSIYGFRSAKPEIFAKMKNEYPPLNEAENSNCASIFMSKNFRCDRGIVDFVNGIFDGAFELAGESIGYVREDRLDFGKIYDGGIPEYREPEIMLFDKSSSLSPSDDEDTDTEEVKASDMPPLWVAKKVKELIEGGTLNDGRQISPSDIAIILRKDGGRSRVYADALSALGIAAKIPDDKDFFLNAEIELCLALLNTVNNPLRDIYLAALMCSPLYSFTADELYFIKTLGGGDSLWKSLILYSENFDFEKGKRFISSILHYRAIAEGMPVDELVLRLYRETGLLTLASKNGKRENLMLLYNFAREFESSSFEGLYSFINYINKVIEDDAEFSAKKDGKETNSVTITTIHKSKGLEYPVVFLADAASSLISSRDRQLKVPYSEDFGAAMRLRMKNGLALVDSPIFNTVMDYSAEKTVEEELRVYYVALTRAREQLYITGCVSAKDIDEYFESIKVKKLFLSPYTLKDVKSFADIMCIFMESGIILSKENGDALEGTEAPVSDEKPQDDEDSAAKAGCSEELKNELIRRFEYEYPFRYMTELPEKMSVSRLHPTVLDGSDEESEVLFEEDEEENADKKIPLPSFITGTSENESALRGIATHLVLQFADLENLNKSGTEKELARLLEKEFISKKDLSRVRKNEIELFRKSELFFEMMRARRLYREMRFNVYLPANMFTEDEEKKNAYKDKKILLQGVIDCIIEDKSGELHLVDYKTDRLTREELSDISLAEKKLREKHTLQLSYYAESVKEIFGKYPKTVRVYSLPLGKTISII